MRHRPAIDRSLRRDLPESRGKDPRRIRRGFPALYANGLLCASATGLFGLALAGCGSSVNYICDKNLCTANQPAAQLQLSAAAYSVSTGAAPAKLVVTRSGEGEGAVSVHFATADGTGAAGVDYTASEGTLTWAAGDRAPKTVPVFLKHQPMRRGSRSFAVHLSAPSEGAALGTVESAVVMVEGDDGVKAR